MDALVQSGKTDWFLLGFFRESIGFWFFLGMFALVILCGALSVRELVRGRHTAAGAPRG